MKVEKNIYLTDRFPHSLSLSTSFPHKAPRSHETIAPHHTVFRSSCLFVVGQNKVDGGQLKICDKPHDTTFSLRGSIHSQGPAEVKKTRSEMAPKGKYSGQSMTILTNPKERNPRETDQLREFAGRNCPALCFQLSARVYM